MATVLWLGDGGCHTGFARVTHAIGDRLVDRGHDVHVLATNFSGDYWPTKVKMYVPNSKVPKDFYGRSRIIEMLAKVQPDVVVMLNNPSIVLSIIGENAYDKDKVLLQHRPIIGYLPIDGYNHPRRWDILKQVIHPIAMSKHGQIEFMPDAPLAYHGVDHDRFRPVSTKDPVTTSTGIVCKSKADCKAAFNYPRDSFLVLRVDRNDGRKDYGASWKALLPSMRRHTDIITHFHCQAVGDFGTDLRAVFSRDEATEKRFFTPDMVTSYMGYTEADLIALYNAADLFLSTSRGEGFGLTIAEAMACGVPVIAQNVTAIPEVVGPGGELIEPERELTVPEGDDQWLADIGAFSEAIEHAYLSRAWRRDKGKAAREHVVSTFNWDEATDVFDGKINDLASTIAGPLVGAAS